MLSQLWSLAAEYAEASESTATLRHHPRNCHARVWSIDGVSSTVHVEVNVNVENIVYTIRVNAAASNVYGTDS